MDSILLMVDVELGQDDIDEATRWTLRYHNAAGWILFFTMAVVMGYRASQFVHGRFLLLFLTLEGLSLGGCLYIQRRFAYRLTYAKVGGRAGSWRYVFSDSGLRTEPGTHLEWSGFRKAVETERLYLLIRADRSFWMLSKRSFQPEQEQTFRALLHEKLGSRARLRS